jgi:hypothetical protein
MIWLTIRASLACGLLAACGLDAGGKNRCDTQTDCLAGYVCADHACVVPATDPIVDAGGELSGPGFRIASARLPLGERDRGELGLDLDRDPGRAIDNRWDRPLDFVSDLGWYSQGALDEHLAEERLLILGELTGDADAVTLRLRVGRRRLDRPDRLEVVPGAPPVGDLVGARRDGRLALGPGTLTVPVTLLTGMQSAATIELVGARIEVAESAGPGAWRDARLGGGVTPESLRAALPPVIAGHLQDVVAIDCTGVAPACCRDGTSGQRLVRELDGDRDCAITAAEVAAHRDFAALAPDVDLLDASGALAPRADGVVDCVSVGLGLATAPATFELAH